MDCLSPAQDPVPSDALQSGLSAGGDPSAGDKTASDTQWSARPGRHRYHLAMDTTAMHQTASARRHRTIDAPAKLPSAAIGEGMASQVEVVVSTRLFPVVLVRGFFDVIFSRYVEKDVGKIVRSPSAWRFPFYPCISYLCI